MADRVKARVINLTRHSLHLQSADMDSLTVLPNPTGGTGVDIDLKFLTWIPQHPDDLQVAYYMDHDNNRYTTISDPEENTGDANTAEEKPAEENTSEENQHPLAAQIDDDENDAEHAPIKADHD